MEMTRVIGVMIVLASTIWAQTTAFDVGRMDRSVDACTDFFQYANGTWLKKTEIPAAYPGWGSFYILDESNRANLRAILDEAAKNKSATKGSTAQLISDYYGACMDTDAIEKLGAKPLDPYFKQIDAIKNTDDVVNMVAGLHRVGVGALFGFGAFPDFKNSTMNIAFAVQGGLGLPNRDYYTNTDAKSVEIRGKYVEHVAKMFVLLGDPSEKAKAKADTIMKIETRLALASKAPVELRDPVANYNKMSVADADQLAPSLKWEAYSAKLGTPRFTEVNVGQPAFFREVGKMLGEVPIEDWKTYLRWNVVNTFADRLSKSFDDQNFDFYYRTLSGTQEQLPRWRRCASSTDAAVGEALGQEYVKKYFTPEAKKRMDELITNLFAAYRDRISKLDWMTDATRQQALTKLAAIQRKIGYPDKLRGYAGLSLDHDSYFANTVRANEFLITRDLKDIGTTVDKTRWGMTPPTVNAYYNPLYNEIVFPAGILQPPFFNFQADDAINYGGIGSVIGHEMTHGFDDQGSQFDASGNLRMWWTPEDRKKFEERADCVATQYSGYEVDKGLFLNGKLTLGENIADLGGLSIAYDAYQRSLSGKPKPASIDGFTPDQRFFLGYAQVWAEKSRPESDRQNVLSDPHSMPRFRVNGVVVNLPEFNKAFSCRMGDRMVNAKPCKVW
jgi:putative endopeptidase